MHREARTHDVLVVDDEPTNLDLLSRRLQRAGYRVTVAGCAAEARSRIASRMPSLVLLDVCMPGESGLELLRALRAEPSTTLLPVIMVTALSDTESIVAAIRDGANDYVTKPIDMPVLLARMETHLKIAALIMKLEAQTRILAELAAFDELTGLYNRRSVLGALEAQLALVLQRGRPFSLLMLDLDHFKAVNDSHGHAAGDAVLGELARRISGMARETDVVGRLGGEEFCVLLPDTDAPGALATAERVRELVGALPFTVEGGAIGVTVSVGVATTSPGAPLTSGELLAEADRALYAAKRAGRNRVCVGVAWAVEA